MYRQSLASVVLLASLGAFGASGAFAQDQPPNPFGDESQTQPQEEDGPPGPVFTDGGTSGGVVTLCDVPCGPGSTCVHGQCVSRCSPACGPGLQCSAQGTCVAAQPAPGPTGQPNGPPAPNTGYAGYQPPPPREPVPGTPAVVRGAVGLGLGALVAGLGVGAWAAEDANPDSAASIVLTGVGAAASLAGVIAARSGSSYARGQGGARGVGFFRVTTWIFLIGALLFDVIAMSLSATHDSGGTWSDLGRLHLVGGIAGALALVSAGADALVAGLQQNELYRAAQGAGEQTRWIPRLGRMRDVAGQSVPALGWGGAF